MNEEMIDLTKPMDKGNETSDKKEMLIKKVIQYIKEEVRWMFDEFCIEYIYDESEKTIDYLVSYKSDDYVSIDTLFLTYDFERKTLSQTEVDFSNDIHDIPQNLLDYVAFSYVDKIHREM